MLLIIDLHLSTEAAECRDVVSPIHKLVCEANTASLAFLRYVLDGEKPEFVAFTGDQINVESAPNSKSVFYYLESEITARSYLSLLNYALLDKFLMQ